MSTMTFTLLEESYSEEPMVVSKLDWNGLTFYADTTYLWTSANSDDHGGGFVGLDGSSVP